MVDEPLCPPVAHPALAAPEEIYRVAARNPATVLRYEQSWAAWAAWAEAHELPASMPVAPAPVGRWLAEEADAGVAYATLQLRVTALRVLHAQQGQALDTRHPAIRDVLKGIRRTHGTAQRQAKPIMVEHLRVACGPTGLPATLHGMRDRAMLLVGWAGGFRASELAALAVGDVAWDDDGMVLTVRRSKTDQDGAGREVAVPNGSAPNTCPARTLRRWLDAAGITSGPIFREMHGDVVGERPCTRWTVDRLVRRVADLCGFDPEKYSSHSLRAGLITSARLAGKADAVIMRTTGHRRVETLGRYDRGAVHLYERAAAGLGL